SATMPKQIRALANDFLRNPMEISVAPQARPIERIDQKIFYIDKGAKRRALTEILSGPDVKRTIVFTRTKYGADGVKTYLEKGGFSVTTIHGNRSQRQRESAMKAFRAGRVNVLVATDVAARGIDVDDISHIVNFELPNVPESYVHRICRTARAGKGGIAISLCDGSERKFLRDIERLIGQNLDKSKFVLGETPAPKAKPEFDIAPPTLARESHKRPNNQQRSSNNQPKTGNGEAQSHQGEGKKSQNRKGKPYKHWGKKKGGGGWTGSKPKNRNRRKAA
ncbi:MAG: helicase-related protein, partial [Alphaproteobacteria bacterium]